MAILDYVDRPAPFALAFLPLSLSPTAWYDPSDLTTLWQDTSRTTPVTADGDVVGCMDDKSGNGHHLLQATTASKPLYKTLGGLHWLQFDGDDDFLAITATGIGTATAVVGAMPETGIVGAAGLLTDTVDDGTGVDLVFGRDLSTSNWDTAQAVGSALADSTHIWRNQVQTAAFTLDVAAVYAADGTGFAAATTFGSGIHLGRDRGLSARRFKGRVYGVICVGSSTAEILSSVDRGLAETWMANKAGVTL